jgi:hypothetical protein
LLYNNGTINYSSLFVFSGWGEHSEAHGRGHAREDMYWPRQFCAFYEIVRITDCLPA